MNAVSRGMRKPAPQQTHGSGERSGDALAALLQSEEFTAIALACLTEGARLAVAPKDNEDLGPKPR